MVTGTNYSPIPSVLSLLTLDSSNLSLNTVDMLGWGVSLFLGNSVWAYMHFHTTAFLFFSPLIFLAVWLITVHWHIKPSHVSSIKETVWEPSKRRFFLIHNRHRQSRHSSGEPAQFSTRRHRTESQANSSKLLVFF